MTQREAYAISISCLEYTRQAKIGLRSLRLTSDVIEEILGPVENSLRKMVHLFGEADERVCSHSSGPPALQSLHRGSSTG